MESGPVNQAKLGARWVLLSLILATGCAFSRGHMGDAFNEEDVAAIQKGVTTRAQVTAKLGAPDRILQANGHEILQYYRYDLKAGSLLLILVNFGRFNIKSDDLYVMVNRGGVVDEVVFGKRTDRMEFQWWPFGN